VPALDSEIARLARQATNPALPSGLQEKLKEDLDQLKLNLQNPDSFWPLYQRLSRYFNWVQALPWDKESEDNLDLDQAQKILNEHHYGLDEVKQRILEYLSVLILQKKNQPDQKIRAPILLFVGLVGTGKTTMAKAIAEVMGRPLIRIPFGGLGDPSYLRGQSRLHPESEPGKIIKGLIDVKVKNPVILLDEIDRIADSALNAVMGVLVELLDPEQNQSFLDNYLDYPFDLSQAFFVATCNNTTRIATAVLDRLEPVQMPSYNDEEKTAIGREYLLPRALQDSGLSSKDLIISPDSWTQIVRPLGFDAGVRTLKRNIEGLCRKAAMLLVQGKISKVVIDTSNLKHFIPRW